MHKLSGLLLAMMAVSTSCHAVQGGICHESVTLIREKLQRSALEHDQVTYKLAFGGQNLTPSEVYDLRDSEQMHEALSILAGEDGEGRLAYLLNLGLNANSTVPGGAPVIVAAAECRNLPAVNALLRGGADMYAYDSQDMDAMATAITEDAEAVVEALNASGYRVDPQTKQGQLVLRLAKLMHGGKYQQKIKLKEVE